MRRLLFVALLGASRTAVAEPMHLTGEWRDTRTKLGAHGVAIDAFYAAEAFVDRGGLHDGTEVLGHLDLALTLDSGGLGAWKGGRFFLLFQNNVGDGIDADVGSAAPVSNLEAPPYTQVTEVFVEQFLWDSRIDIRVGKQDANRDFGTPRFGGNFVNGNFGMYPTTPLPSYPATDLGAMVSVLAQPWLAVKAAVYDNSIRAGGIAATRHYGPNDRDDGITSLGVWQQSGSFAELHGPRMHDSDWGFFVQHDEHVYRNPSRANDATGLTLTFRYSWAQSDRTNIAQYLGASAAWHGLGLRHDDTVGLGVGAFTVGDSTISHRPGEEEFVEAFYKWRVTPYASVQPDVQVYRHPGGDGANALIAGARVKLKL